MIRLQQTNFAANWRLIALYSFQLLLMIRSSTPEKVVVILSASVQRKNYVLTLKYIE